MRNLIRRVSYWIQQRRLQAELAEEMAQHRALTERALEDGGLDPAEARLAARRTFGSAALAQDRARDVWIPAWLQGLPADVRLAVRTLWATRIVSLVAVGSLA